MLRLSGTVRRGRAVVVSGLVAAGSLVLGAGAAQAANAACPGASSTTATSCTYTSGTPIFTVPAGIGSLDVVAVGAAGGGGYGSENAGPNGNKDGSGGSGASVEDAAVPVVPNQDLGLFVGTVGGSGGNLGPGGIPGGGTGGSDGSTAQGQPFGGGGGGGFSGVEALDSTALVVAGGGGGGGESYTPFGQAGSGGGGDSGSGGGVGGVGAYGGTGGGGGSATSYGAAGSNVCSDQNPSSATAGSSEQGGTGVAGFYHDTGDANGAGGGGGGGYYGGGGGGAGCNGQATQFGPDGTGNGGGGGGSYGITGLTNEHVTSDPASLTISWSVPSYLKSFGGSGSGDGQFGGPAGIAIDPSNGVKYVADQPHSRIEVFDPHDKWLFSFATTAPPSGIAGDFSSTPGTLFVAEPGAPGGVEMFDGSGANLGYVTQVPGTGTPLLTGVAVDPSNQTVYVTDSGNNQVDMYDESGNLTGAQTFNGSDSGTTLNDPTGVAVDPGRGRVYVADGQNQRVAVFDLSGNYLSAIGSGGSGVGQLGLPNGVAVEPETGNVFVVDGNNDRVESFAPDGTYINSFGAAGSGNGRFRSPWGVAFASAGSFFVTDTANNRVEKFGQPGPLSQFAIAVPARPVSGSPQTITVTAMDASGDVIGDYSGSPSWSDTGGQLSGAPAAFSGGVSRNAVTFAKPVHGERITVTDGSVSSQTPAFNVFGPLAKFVTSVSSSQTAGKPFTVRLIAEDSAGNVLTGYRGSPTWSDLSGHLTGSPVAFTSGVSMNTVTLPNAYKSDTITVTDAAAKVTSQTAAFNVFGPLAKFVSGVSSSQTAGQSFTVRVYAEDSAGNVLSGYHGSPKWSDLSGHLTGSPAAFTSGVSTNTVTLPNAYKRDTITVTDVAAKVTSQSSQFNVFGPLAKFVIGVSSSQTAGKAFTVRVNAEDSAGNLLSGYHAVTTWSDSSGQIKGSPAAFSGGVSTNQVTVAKPYSNDRITVTNGSITSQSVPFNIT